MLDYKVTVVGLNINKHPHQEFFTSLARAGEAFDILEEKYPFHTVVFTQLEEKLIKTSNKKVKPLPDCKFHHRRPVHEQYPITKGSIEGSFICAVCGPFRVPGV